MSEQVSSFSDTILDFAAARFIFGTHRSCPRWRRDRRGGALPAVGQHRAGQKDGFAPPLFHDTQHSCASLLLRSGVQMKEIQAWLGHSDISTTANIYAHLDSRSKQLSAATMEQALPLPGELPKSRR